MALTLLRHTTPLVAKGTCYGRTDLDLAPTFEAESEAVLRSLPPATHILTSPLQRCARLAARIGAARRLPVTPSNAFVEMDFGRWEGIPWADLPRKEIDGWAADFMTYRGHGGETVSELYDRVAAGLDAAPEGALIVCHAGVIKAALAAQVRPGAWQHETPFGGFVTI